MCLAALYSLRSITYVQRIAGGAPTKVRQGSRFVTFWKTFLCYVRTPSSFKVSHQFVESEKAVEIVEAASFRNRTEQIPPWCSYAPHRGAPYISREHQGFLIDEQPGDFPPPARLDPLRRENTRPEFGTVD